MAATLDYVPARHEASTYIMSMATTTTTTTTNRQEGVNCQPETLTVR